MYIWGPSVPRGCTSPEHYAPAYTVEYLYSNKIMRTPNTSKFLVVPSLKMLVQLHNFFASMKIMGRKFCWSMLDLLPTWIAIYHNVSHTIAIIWSWKQLHPCNIWCWWHWPPIISVELRHHFLDAKSKSFRPQDFDTPMDIMIDGVDKQELWRP